MVLDSLLNLAFAMHSNRGVYALLLGSGLSRSAGIPTGWEISLDLIKRLAALQGADCEPEPAQWYLRVRGIVPTYDKLLNEVGRLPAERAQLLRTYFEPTDEEREQGLKLPTVAHGAIAQLVARGYVKILITTNFDRLLETALEQAGVQPTVVASPDAVKGMLPLSHARCLLLKLHGDYLDTRIKNTEGELARYDRRVVQLLDRILDEFGLVVCGWSADWDVALRDALSRCKSRRFTTFWTIRATPRPPAEDLIRLRGAALVQIASADRFFPALLDKLDSLQEYAQPHPISAGLAVTTLKRYLADDRHKIRLHDLLFEEIERLCDAIAETNFPAQGRNPTPGDFCSRVARYEGLTNILCHMFTTGIYWSEPSQESIWIKVLERVANLGEPGNGSNVWIHLTRYPALLLLYSGGLGAVANCRFGTLAALTMKAQVRDGSRTYPLVERVHTAAPFYGDVASWLPGGRNRYTPVNDHLVRVLRDASRQLLPEENGYQRMFDTLEYLLALIQADVSSSGEGGAWCELGAFAWRRNSLSAIEAELTGTSTASSLLAAGLFRGSSQRFNEARAFVTKTVHGRNWI